VDCRQAFRRSKLEGSRRRAIMSGLDVELPENDAFAAPLLDAVRGARDGSGDRQRRCQMFARQFQLGLFEIPFVDTLAAAK
jgi:hypothetical protein